MFCPRCGQLAAEEVRFCSRCGLPLDAAAEIVASGGRLARAAAPGDAGGALTPRQVSTRKGMAMTAAGLLFFGITALLTLFRDELFVLFIPAALFLCFGVMLMVAGLLRVEPGLNRRSRRREDPDAAAHPDAERAGARAAAKELPHARTIPASLYTKPAADTSDMAASPLSVTEGTTRLLEEEEGVHRRRVEERSRK